MKRSERLSLFFFFLIFFYAGYGSAYSKEIDVILGSGMEYSDNIFNSYLNKKSDVITTLNSQVNAYLNRLHYQLMVNSGFDYQFFWNHPGINNLNARGSLLFKYDINSTSHLKIADNLMYAKQQTRIEEQMGVVTGRNRFISNNFSPKINWGFTEKLSAEFSYTNELFDSKDINLYSSYMNQGGCKINYDFKNFGKEKDNVYLGYNYMRRTFRNFDDINGDDILAGNGQVIYKSYMNLRYHDYGEVEMHTTSLGGGMVFFKQLTVSPGINAQSGTKINKKNFSDLGASIKFSYSMNEMTSFSVMYEKRRDINSFVNYVYGYNMVNISATRWLDKKTLISLILFLSKVKYEGIRFSNLLQKYSVEISHDFTDDLKVKLAYYLEVVNSRNYGLYMSTTDIIRYKGQVDNRYLKNTVSLEITYKI